MPSDKIRINLTVDDDLNEVLTQLAALEGVPKATLVVNVLNEMRPHFDELIKAIELVKQKKDANKSINTLLINQQKQFLNSLGVNDD